MISLKHLRVGDTIIFADGTQGICTVSYDNGGGRFVRWAVPGKDWSESDQHCCYVAMPDDGRMGWTSNGVYRQAPKDIVDIMKPSLHELQDEIARLRACLAKRQEELFRTITTLPPPY